MHTAADSLNANDASITALLPKRTAELKAMIGLQNALKLVELKGGRRIWVPKKPRADHWLVAEIGLEAFVKLCARYGDTSLEVDMCKGLKRAIVVAEYDNGVPISVLAEKYGCTERNIRRMTVASIDKAPVKLTAKCTLDLFEEFV